MKSLFPLALCLTACTQDPPAGITRPFPDGFGWGTAVAGFQVDMGCPTWSDADCLDTASDWYQWVTDPAITGDKNLFVTGQDVREGPGMWEMFEQDVAQMKADGHTSLRLSLEWSRLFPTEPTDPTDPTSMSSDANPGAVARYHEMFAALRDAGLEPLVTVNHYTLPLWVHDGVACHKDLTTCEANGWVDGDRIIPRIAAFSEWAGMEFGGQVDQWATLNEPFATALSGYLQPGADRSAPPGLTLQGAPSIAVIRNQIEGHARMYEALKSGDTVDASGQGIAANVGIVLNMVDITPEDPVADATVAQHADHLYHRLFLEALTSGQWDDDLDGTFDRARPELADHVDWFGINYYNEMKVRHFIQLFPDIVPAFDFLPTVSWDPHPEGLAKVLAIAATYGKPLIVTENGTPDVEHARDILDDHLASLWSAIDAGVDVRGYNTWSYIDNYEWNHGMDMQFGLYSYDPMTKARTARPAAERYRDIVAQGGLE